MRIFGLMRFSSSRVSYTVSTGVLPFLNPLMNGGSFKGMVRFVVYAIELYHPKEHPMNDSKNIGMGVHATSSVSLCWMTPGN